VVTALFYKLSGLYVEKCFKIQKSPKIIQINWSNHICQNDPLETDILAQNQKILNLFC